MANDLGKTSERGFRVQIMGTANVPLLDSLHDSTLSYSIRILLDQSPIYSGGAAVLDRHSRREVNE